MKNTQKAFVLILCVVLCVAVFSCAGGGRAAATADGFGEGIPATGVMTPFTDRDAPNNGSSNLTMVEGTRDGSPSYHFTGNTTTQYQYGFVGWALTPDEETLANLKAARAISFMFVGDGKRQTVKYRLSSVRDHAHHEFHFAGEPGVPERVEVPIRFFQQPGWGDPVRMNQANVVDLSWQTHESWRPASFEITIWDIRIHP